LAYENGFVAIGRVMNLTVVHRSASSPARPAVAMSHATMMTMTKIITPTIDGPGRARAT
jgi:hypothetical protein